MFYEFSQNNSGGRFSGPAIVVIVEADSANEANSAAEYDAGLYFYGAEDDGPDCPCCGDRWYPIWDKDEGSEVPSVYGEPIKDFAKKDDGPRRWFSDGIPYAKIYYKNGEVETID